MADGIDGKQAKNPDRGRKLRNHGSNPTGDQTMSFTPDYIGDDPTIGSHQYLNQNTRMSEDQYGRDVSSKELRDQGLVIKQPLS